MQDRLTAQGRVVCTGRRRFQGERMTKNSDQLKFIQSVFEQVEKRLGIEADSLEADIPWLIQRVKNLEEHRMDEDKK